MLDGCVGSPGMRAVPKATIDCSHIFVIYGTINNTSYGNLVLRFRRLPAVQYAGSLHRLLRGGMSRLFYAIYGIIHTGSYTHLATSC